MPKLPFKVMVELEVTDKNGRIVKKHRQMSHSFLMQWLQFLRCQASITFAGSGISINVVDETGAVRTYPSAWYELFNYEALICNAPVGDDSYGIVVGVSDAPNTINTYCLGGKIAHGTAGGQLQYGGHTFDDVANPSGNILLFRIIRTFSNTSGSTITVKEVGLMVKNVDSQNVMRSYLVARDVLSTPVNVYNNMTLTVRYIFQITVS
ncbi:MAG: hypothetical protein NDF51_02250 [archaeon YNP-WB-040]|nr:hypothetical protein [Candidatus Culexarchaeum yellowstonense]